MQGLKHGMAYTKLYSVWGGMKTRCRNPNACNFMYYGGRGIDYCERWNIFENFYEDMGEVPEGMTKVVIKPHKAKSFKSIEKAIEYRDLLKSSVNF